jgi:beta-phosphoglucomutase-like phosphatase (HAD superfamily)
MSRPKLVIFDCDGVLVDTERIAVRVDAVILARIGWPLTEAEITERFVGHSDDYMRGEIQKHLGRALAPDWDAEYLHLYREAFDAELQPVDGIVEALDRIRTPTCVANRRPTSSCTRRRGWASRPPTARSSRTARSVSRPRAPQACRYSAMRAA